MSRRPGARAVPWVVAMLGLLGCAGRPAGDLELRSLADAPLVLSGDYRTALYGHDPDGGSTFLVSDLPAAALRSGDYATGQVMHIELLWVPKAGATPMDDTATNASVRHVIFIDGEVGVYGGAGFVLPAGQPGQPTLRLDVRQATLTLLESTDGFRDVLGAARLTGALVARHDRRQTRRAYFTLCQRVTDALGRSRFVDAPLEPPAPAPGRPDRLALDVPGGRRR